MLIEMRNLRKIHDCIARSGTIAISGHTHPDGDSIGSLLALGLGLRKLKKKVYMLCQDEIPIHYRNLPGADTIVKTVARKVDLAIAVDCSAMELLGKNIPVFERAKKILTIDHHYYAKPFGDLEYIDPQAASVGEMAYILLGSLGIAITRNISENILTSIIVETNLFKVSNIRPITFSVCAEGLRTGIDFSALVNKVYGPRTKEAAMLLSICLLRSRPLKRGKIIWSVVRKSDFKKVGGKDYDADAIASDMLALKGVKASVLFRESARGLFRVSLRSTGNIDIGRIAKIYGGGGHFDIAGCYIPGNAPAMRNILNSVSGAVD